MSLTLTLILSIYSLFGNWGHRNQANDFKVMTEINPILNRNTMHNNNLNSTIN